MTPLILCTENKEQPTTLKAIKKTERQKGTYCEHIINSIKQSLNEADSGLLTPYKGTRDMLDME